MSQVFKYVVFLSSTSGCWHFNVGSYRLSNVAAQQVVKVDGPEVSRLAFNTAWRVSFYFLNICLELH